MPSNKKNQKERRKRRRKEQFQQLRLGITEQNELTLVRFKTKKPKSIVHYEIEPELFNHLPFSQLSASEIVFALRPPFPILRLPEELVLQILTEAVRTERHESNLFFRRKRCKLVLSLCLVCKAFYRLVQPLLFSVLTVQFPDQNVPATDATVTKLDRTLQTKQYLAQYCRDLLVCVPNNWPKDFDAITRVPCQFVNVKSLQVLGLFNNSVGNGDFSEDSRDLWAFLRPIIQSINGVEELQILTRCGGFSRDLGLPLYPLCTTLSDMQRLKSLTIYGISGRFDGSPFVLPKNLEGASTITALNIYACCETPSALKEFLKWPSKLETLSIYDIYWHRNSISLQDFRSALYRHRGSLKSLRIGNVRATGPIVLSDFKSLESVHLFSRTMSSEWVPEVLCDCILAAPQLHSLIWDFLLFDEQIGVCTSCRDFGSVQAEWLRKVVIIAHQRRLALRQIRIIFHPSDLAYCRNEMRKEKSAWEWMEDVRVEMERLGMELLIDSNRK